MTMKIRTGMVQWRKQWPDVLIGLLGAWFAASPWVLDLQRSGAVLAASLALGLALLALAVLALLALHASRRWDHWAQAAVAAGIAASPWLVGFAGDPLAWRNALAVGLMAFLLAAWLAARDEKQGRGILHGTEELAH